MIDPLIVDIYSGDLKGKPDVAKLIAAGPPWHGLILKATEGLYYPSQKAQLEWFNKYWPETKDLAGDRYGNDWFRGAYHYITIKQDPVKQADRYLSMIEQAGGWGKGDLFPIVDVEGAGNPDNASAQQVIDCVTKWANKVKLETGRIPILYGNNYLNDRGIKDHMGCELLWVARYSASLPDVVYKRIGWALDKLFGWQYGGDGEAYLANYPKVCPMGATDISALTIGGGGIASLAWLRSHLYAEAPNQ